MRNVLIALVFAVGCSATAEVPVATEEQVDDCSRAFSPDAASLPYIASVAERWSAATECDIHIADGGIPVTMVDWIEKPGSDDSANGVTRSYEETCTPFEIKLWSQSEHKEKSAGHEVGHVISTRCPGLPSNHTATGIMSEDLDETKIDSASLELICENLPCLGFNPEI